MFNMEGYRTKESNDYGISRASMLLGISRMRVHLQMTVQQQNGNTAGEGDQGCGRNREK